MREWRVGTLSMGLLLVGSGIGLLYGQINKVGIADLAFKWWPLIFILLGIEVLVQYYFRKNAENKIKYDVFSIFIILIIVMAGICIQTASELGLSSYVQRELKSDNYELTTSPTRIEASKARNIIIHAENAPQLVVTDSSSTAVSIYGRGQVRAESRRQASRKLAEGAQVSSRLEGNTLYIDLNTGMYPYRYYVTLPSNTAVEMDRGGTSVDINLSRIGNDWIIKGDGYTQVAMPASTDLLVSALDTDMNSIHGNVSWVSRDGKTLSALLKEQQAQQDQGQMADANGNSSYQSPEFKAAVGKATYKLTMIGSSEVNVNLLP